MGKWSHVVGKYPELADAPSPYRDARDELVSQIRTQTSDDLARLAVLRDEADAARELLALEMKETNLRLDAAETAIRKVMFAKDLDSFVTNGLRYTSVSEPYPQVTDQYLVRKWALETAPDDLRLLPQTLKRLTKEAIESNSPLPGGVEVYLKTTISVRKVQ